MTTTQVSSESHGQYKANAYAAASAKSPLAPMTIPRRDPGEHDVQIEILFCGICHSDLHTVRGEWSAFPTVYPCVPGHEIVGRVTKVGSSLELSIVLGLINLAQLMIVVDFTIVQIALPSIGNEFGVSVNGLQMGSYSIWLDSGWFSDA